VNELAVKKMQENRVRERIEDVSARLFSRKGYDAVSIREIAEGAGVTKPAIYYYFDGKKALYDSLLKNGFERLHRRIREAVSSEDQPEDKLLAAINAHFSFCLDNIDTMKFIYLCTLESTEHTALSSQSFRIIEDIFSEAHEKGKFQKGNPRELSIALMGIINIYLMRQLAVRKRILSEELGRKILKMIS
jgi:TetR/AcrR family transcriptional regulator